MTKTETWRPGNDNEPIPADDAATRRAGPVEAAVGADPTDPAATGTAASGTAASGTAASGTAATPEDGGPSGPEPTRYGDWERKGRCIDF